jgi:hypothetical protein
MSDGCSYIYIYISFYSNNHGNASDCDARKHTTIMDPSMHMVVWSCWTWIAPQYSMAWSDDHREIWFFLDWVGSCGRILLLLFEQPIQQHTPTNRFKDYIIVSKNHGRFVNEKLSCYPYNGTYCDSSRSIDEWPFSTNHGVIPRLTKQQPCG